MTNEKIAKDKLNCLKQQIIKNSNLTHAEISLKCFNGGVANVSMSSACESVVTQQKRNANPTVDKFEFIDAAFNTALQFIKKKEFTGTAGLRITIKRGIVVKIVQFFSYEVNPTGSVKM